MNEIMNTTIAYTNDYYYFVNSCPHESFTIEKSNHPMLKHSNSFLWCTFCDLGIDEFKLINYWKSKE